MKRNNFKGFVRQSKVEFKEPFHPKESLGYKIHDGLAKVKILTSRSRWKSLLNITAAVLLGILAVWGVNEYRKLLSYSQEKISFSFNFDNIEHQLIRHIDMDGLVVGSDLKKDLVEINQTQQLLKMALKEAPEIYKNRIYDALMDTYELKISLLEEVISTDRMEHEKTRKNPSNL